MTNTKFVGIWGSHGVLLFLHLQGAPESHDVSNTFF